jgi:hypothetical protein
MLVEKIKNRESGIVLYGIVPPKIGTNKEKIKEISSKQVQRLDGRKIDGLILYDIQDEALRTSKERPFPFLETLDSFMYSREYMASLTIPKLIYRSVGKYRKDEFSHFLIDSYPENELSVFV